MRLSCIISLSRLLFFLVLSLPLCAQYLKIAGEVKDPAGLSVHGANLALQGGGQVLQTTTTASDGRFSFRPVTAGEYALVVEAPGFNQRRLALKVTRDLNAVTVQLSMAPVRESVTVTTDPGRALDTSQTSQTVNVIGYEQIQERVRSVAAQAFNEEEGLSLQRTSPTISGVFVRGLTGNKVNVFVDGVRYSNAAARGGINTFLNLLSAGNLQAIEVLRGPNSAQFGSDALGGSVQMLTLPVPVGSEQPVYSGSFSAMGSTADWSAGSDASFSAGTKRFGFTSSLSGMRSSRLRPGRGVDSHSVFLRFFGVPSDGFTGNRLPDTAFTQYGALLKMVWAIHPDTQVTAMYTRNHQDGGRRADQLLGGDGNSFADLRNLMNDVFYIRLERRKAKLFDRLSLNYSYNVQREERVTQGGNGDPTATIAHEPERTKVHGIQFGVDKRIAKHDLLFGADFYHERLLSPAFGVNPVTQAVSLRRPRVPHKAGFNNGGIYLQDTLDLLKDKLQLLGAMRYSAASYRVRSADSPVVPGSPLWPDDSLHVNDLTYRFGVVGHILPTVTLYGNFSKGFRAPHMTDLGTLGLTGSGFEVAAPDVAGMNATVGNTADRNAVSTGRPVIQLLPETSFTYEGGIRFTHLRARASFTLFVNDIDDNITRQTLILPAGAVGQSLGGQAITSQSANGAVFVAATSNPVLVRANFDDARLWGLEHRGDFQLNNQWSFGTVFTYIHAADQRTGLAPNIEGGTPAADGYVTLRYQSKDGRWWIEPYIHAAGRQDRLSTLDLEDRRTGATRSRSNIANFFNRGARVRGFTGAGADATFGTVDDILLATGETLSQIQDRVLGAGVNSAPLYTAVPGYITVNLRGGVRVAERQRLFVNFENMTDRNYRGISWGVDAPGRNLTLRYTVNF